jgi:hypothetical protein
MLRNFDMNKNSIDEVERDNLNLASEDFNFDEIDEDLALFQEDDMVQQALQRGVDLKKYGRELELELRTVSY